MKKLLLCFCFLTLIHCRKNESQSFDAANLVDVVEEDKMMSAKPQNAEIPPPPPPREEEPLHAVADNSDSDQNHPVNTQTVSKKIIKNGDMKIQVGDVQKSREQINTILKSNKAYLQKEEFHNTDVDENLDLTIRVPHQNFDALINSFSNGIGSVLSKNISSDDVTEEYTDVSIKLANKKIYLEKYREMLKSAKTTKDMLEIQENIRALEDEIDVSEGRLRFIDDRVNYSTLNLSLYKEKVRSSATSRIGFGSRFGDSLTEGWNSFVEFLLGIISLWPFLLLVPVIVFLWRKWRNKRKK
ncbi:DUF4349 domain-containing protein [uncultured Chryseobacterium sp.]|uniref:DUF4349 domain-containing protein n=1 Tax=uncultured Chryseobacterium sp. TaxID=259322 RepID=UPI0025D973EF|nr:DUF4349 domain-containing protein [uncultured Chryseobacterium sp.]